MWVLKSRSPEETSHIGEKVAGLLKRGDIVCLTGNLGAGKTLLTKGIIKGLAINEDVTSPTFTILNIYDSGAVPVYHFDLYRIEREDELQNIGFEEYVRGDGIAIIEWPDKFFSAIPDEYLLIEIKKDETEVKRLLTVTGKGSRYRQIGEELKSFVGASFRYCEPGV